MPLILVDWEHILLQVGVHLSSGRPPRADDLPTAHQYRGADVSRNGSAHAPAGFWGAHEPPQSGDFPKLDAPVVLVFWDPIGPGPSARLPQLMHLARIQVCARDLCHFFRCVRIPIDLFVQ